MEITTEEMEIRIRLPRIAVIISSHTTSAEYLRVIEFLSLVRGGKYARFIFANMKTLEFVSFLEDECRKFQPEIIIAAGEQDRHILRKHCLKNARPEILELYADIQKNFAEHKIGQLPPWQRVVQQEYKRQPDLNRDNVCLLNTTTSPDFELFIATLYGKLSEELSEYIHHMLQATIENVTVANAKELYALNALMAPRISWLDFLNQDSGLISSSLNPPKVIVVNEQEPLRDLTLFWNISRQYGITTRDENILLFRGQDVENAEALSALAETISRTTIKSDHCHILTAGDDNSICSKIARSLRPRLQKRKTKTYHVDVEKSVVAPYLQCYEKQQNTTISCKGAIVTVPRIDPIYDHHSLSNAWYLDLVKTRKTNRYPFEFALPKDADILDLLNIPSGRFVAFRRLVSFSEECLSISLTSSDASSSVRFELPSERELFEVIFRRDQWRLRNDEKNTRYSRALTLFPSLNDVAIALTGTSWKIINALKSEPLTEGSLWGKAGLGRRKKSIPLPEMADMVSKHQYGLYRELFERRVKRELTDTISALTPAEYILEYLVKRNVIFRKWKLDECPGCEGKYWETDLDIRKPLFCPGCRTYIPYKDKVTLGYELNPLIRLALDEGMRPVILTARFLRNLTRHGFLMYPGVKLKKPTQETDIDICAIGDEILIAGECKNLGDFKKGRKILWEEILSQITLPIKVAKSCGFRVFFIASLTERYSKSFQNKVVKLAGDSLKLLFLTKGDLEIGRRKYNDEEGHERTLNLYDVLNPRKPFRRSKNKRKIRSIGF